MTALSVRADSAARDVGAVDEVIASLPLSLTSAANGADVVAIAGEAGWPAHAVDAIEQGARAVLLVRPVDADASELARLAQQRSVVVVVDTPWAGNPVIPAARTLFQDAARSGGSLELRLVVSTTDDLQQTLVDALYLARAVLGEVTSIRPLTRTNRALHAEGRIGDIVVDIAIVRSDATPPNASARLLAPERGVELQLPDWRVARPARLITITGDGLTAAPALFESAHRATWRRLLHHVRTGTPSCDLTHWRADSATAARVTVPRDVRTPRNDGPGPIAPEPAEGERP